MSPTAQSTVDYVKRLANARRRRARGEEREAKSERRRARGEEREAKSERRRARGFLTRFRRESHVVGVTEARRSGFSYYRRCNNLCSVPARIGGRLYERVAVGAPVGGVNPSQESF
jgi:hypothetical protein